MKEKKATKAVMKLVDKFYDHVPAFTDVFDEESFYLFAAVITAVTCIAGFLASRYITVKDKG